MVKRRHTIFKAWLTEIGPTLWLVVVETAAGCKKAISNNNTKIMIDDATYSLLKNVALIPMQA